MNTENRRRRPAAWSTVLMLGLILGLALAVTSTQTIACYANAVSSPQLNIIMPRGVQRGTRRVMNFRGARLQETQQVFLYSSGVTVDKIEQVDDSHVKVTVTVAEDCRLGEHLAQLRTSSGISEYRSFFVGQLPETKEVEPNNDFATPQKLELNQTVTGTITPEDVDYFQIQVKQGQRVSIEVEGIRLGNRLVDPFIAVLDENRFELFANDDTLLLNQDCFLSFVPEQDAIYTVLLRDASYDGNNGCHYRMHVGNFPRPQLVFPAGAKPGQDVALKFLGDPTGPVEQNRTVTAQDNHGLFMQDDLGISPSPVAFRVNDFENSFEQEPNTNMATANPMTSPVAINGIIQEPGDVDFFAFEMKKGQILDLDAFAQRINSPLDVVINVFGPDKKHLQGNDDSRGADSYFRFTAQVDGVHYLRIRDLLRRGAQQFIYRIEVSAPKPQLAISIPRVDRYSQTRQSIFVPQGNRFGTLISATRQNFGGELKLLEDQLPDGIVMHQSPMASNLNQMPVVFEAAIDAELDGTLVNLIASHVEDEKQIRGSYANRGLFVRGPPNNNEYVSGEVDRLPMAVVNKLPFKIDIIPPAAPLVRDGNIGIKVVVQRDEGFNGPITLQFPFRPPGVGTRRSIKIAAGKSEAVYPLNANANAQIRKWPIYVLANADVAGNAWASSQLAELEVAERLVTFEMQRAACEQGQTTEIICKLNHISPFEGQATAELLGIPPDTEVEKLQFDSTTEQLVFKVKTKPETPAGKHSGVFCRVRIPYNSESIVATAGRTELQVQKPLPKQSVAAKPAQTEDTKPQEKPLSRLEKLRQAAREQKGSK